MNEKILNSTARGMVARGRGILAADESTSTIGMRFDSIKVENTEENRRAYRDLLFSTKSHEKYTSGVIFYEETLFQKAADGTPFPKLLEKQGVIPGIKVDKGAKDLAGAPGETITEGLDGLRERLVKYRDAGARFAKWRAVITIGKGIPTDYCIQTNAHALARYAALCQEQDIVPIVEPEVLMDSEHGIERCAEVSEAVLHAVFRALHRHHVTLELMLLKPNMVVPGKAQPTASPAAVAEATLKVLRRTVPAAVPSINFLSGGLSPEDATANLNALNQATGPAPWRLSISYGRALQQPALRAWGGKPENVPAAQQALLKRARLNSLAMRGGYTAEMESD